jgi:acid phosphatase (class A)
MLPMCLFSHQTHGRTPAKFQKMNTVLRPLALSLFLALLADSTRAADSALHYLQPGAIQPQNLLPGPPSVGSEEYKAEIDTLLALQAGRSTAQIARFKAEEKLGFSAFALVMPSFFKAENLRKLSILLDSAGSDSKYFTTIAKDHFLRKRPYREDDRVHPLGKPEEDMAYPSGHATKGMVWAIILARLEPSRTEKLLERGREIGWDRVIGGMHRPSDVEAGRVLGQAIAQALLRNQDFLADLKDSQAEYESVKKENGRRPLTVGNANQAHLPQ